VTSGAAQGVLALRLYALSRHLPSLAGPSAFVLVLAMVVVPLPPFGLDILFTFEALAKFMVCPRKFGNYATTGSF